MIGEDFPRAPGMPTEASVKADLERALGAEAAHSLSNREAFHWLAWETICVSRYVGQPMIACAQAARIPRRTLYSWFQAYEGLQDLVDSYEGDATARLAARLHQFAEADEDSLTTRWMAERRCEQFRPAPKQVEVSTTGNQGLAITLNRGDGTIVKPPQPEAKPDASSE